MNTPHDDMPDHDPEISALYRKTGDIAPPSSLDEAVLASARSAIRQRRQRWMLPLSTAAVLMLGITVLLKLNSEWLPSGELDGGAPTSATHEKRADKAPAEMLAKKSASESLERQALKAAPPSLATAPSSEQPRQAARAKTESAESFGLSADSEPMMDSTIQEAKKSKDSESPIMSGITQAEQKVLQPKAWIEKIRKLMEAKDMDESRKELKAFKKRYPDYKLPDDLKSLIP